MACVSNNCACVFYTGAALTNINVLSGQTMDIVLSEINKAVGSIAPKTITLTGDVTGIGSGLITTTLRTVNTGVGTFGDSTHIPVITVNAKGLITAVSSVQASGTGSGGGNPGGSSGQLQYNAAGSFGGTAAGVYATTGNLFGLTAQLATDVPLTIKGAGSQSANLQNWVNSSSTTLASVDSAGNITATNLSGTNSGTQTITLTGNVTGSGTGSFATTIATNAVANTMLRTSAGLSLVGRSANSTGNVADITAVTDGHILRLSGTTLGFGTIATAGISDAAITYGKIQNVAASRLIGNPTGSPAAASEISLGTGLDFTGGTLEITPNSVNQKVNVLKNGSSVGTRKSINFVEGASVALTITDDSGNDRINATIDVTGGGSATAGGSNGQLQYNNSSALGGTISGTYSTSGNLFAFTAQAATDIPVTVKGASSQSVDLQRWINNSSTILAKIDSAGNITATNLSGTNTGNVTKSGENYISLSGQAITANAVNLSNTNVTGVLAATSFPALTGDVTTSAGSLVTTISANAVTTPKINNSAVTYAKIQNVSTTNRLLGRSTAGAGIIEEITVGAGLTLSGGVLTSASGSGTVTSVAVSSTDLSVSGSPITGAGTITLNVNSSAITFAKIQNITTQKLLGRFTTGSGVVQEVTLGSGLALDATSGILSVTSGGTGTVTSVAVTGTHGIGVTGSPITTAGTITLSLAAITPTTVNGLTLTANSTGFSIAGGITPFTLVVSGNSTLSGTNTGDVNIGGETYLSISGQALTANAVNLSGTHVTGILAAARMPALTGDITNSAGTLTTSIANNAVTTAKINAAAVTYPKIQNVSATNRLLGRASAGSGVIEEITIGSGLNISGTTLSASGGGGGGPQPFITLSDALTVNWAFTSSANAYLQMIGQTSTTNHVLSITGDVDGDYGTIIIEQGGVGGHKINIPTGDFFLDGTNIVGNSTRIDLNEAVGSINILSYVKRVGSPTRRYWTMGYYHN